MSRCSLYNLDVPDETVELDVKDAHFTDVLRSCYRQWCSALYKKDTTDKPSYECGRRIIRPFRKKFSGTLVVDKRTLPSAKGEPWEYNDNGLCAGYFFSAVLNETDLRRLFVDVNSGKDRERDYRLGYLGYGYRIAEGKILEVLQGENMRIGEHAEGGIVVNRGKARSMGKNCEDGLFINHGKLKDMGFMAKGGVHVNLHEIAGLSLAGSSNMGFGWGAKNGVFLNFGEIDSVGNIGDGVFVTQTKVDNLSRYVASGAWALSPDVLKLDADLAELMESVKAAAEQDKYDDVKKYARLVDGHVRENFRPKKSYR